MWSNSRVNGGCTVVYGISAAPRLCLSARLGLTVHLDARAGEAHDELERLVSCVTDLVESVGRRHHTERSRADRTRLVTHPHFAFSLQNEEALLDVAIAGLVPMDRDLLAWIDLGGAERELRRPLGRVEVDRAANARNQFSQRLVGAGGHSHRTL